jgi:phosphoglycolate phosphatase-like HAD superfamily hydrolase
MTYTWIFDLDDTLMACEDFYSKRILAFYEVMHEEFGELASTKEEFFSRVYKENMRLIDEQGGFAYEFPKSFVAIYWQLCKEAQQLPDTGLEKDLFRLGLSVFDKDHWENVVFPEAIPLLQFLHEKGDELILYTKGPEDVQHMKINVNNIQQFFSEIHVTNQKTNAELLRIIGQREKHRVFKVGNSIRSDVNLATNAGIRAIYIPKETWAYETAHNGMNHPHLVVTLGSLQELREKYTEITTTFPSDKS